MLFYVLLAVSAFLFAALLLGLTRVLRRLLSIIGATLARIESRSVPAVRKNRQRRALRGHRDLDAPDLRGLGPAEAAHAWRQKYREKEVLLKPWGW